jgi:transcriptional regulator with XRE-family HTH domain
MGNVSNAEANGNVALFVGQRVREFRTARRMTLAAISRVSGLSARRCAEIEWGAQEELVVTDIIALARALHVHPRHLLENTLNAGSVVFAQTFDVAPAAARGTAMRMLFAGVAMARRVLRVVSGGGCAL